MARFFERRLRCFSDTFSFATLAAPLDDDLFTKYNEQLKAVDDEMDGLRTLISPQPPSTPRRTRPRERDEAEPQDAPANRRRRL